MKRQVCRQPNSFYCPKIRKGREAPHIVFSASLGGKKKKSAATLYIDTSENSCQISCFARLRAVAAFAL